ncbi:ATP-binding protein [Leisingera sp. SS27]|uniref:sensor histidine kinase n=1 Tax=Leisingera sp. SS27 TaxID=2979462 RepID=UPI00232F2C61|nr:ATP-binding protein [Leisingera sp. SS27]MDC0658867.1 ATP-binding protein [Leisingera sp. SS27]
MTLSDFGLFHFSGLRERLQAPGGSGLCLDRAEDFFLEGMAVYDMALRGYVSGTAKLRKEVAERRRVEEELRDITFELARQRDELDAEVQKRTAEIQFRAEELECKNRQLIQTNQDQSNFTYALSHDLKTPINTIHCFLDVLLEDFEGELPPDAAGIIRDLTGTAQRMRQLVDDVLDYSRVVGHQFTPEAVNLQEMVQQILQDIDSLVVSAQAKIHVGELPVIMGSPFQIRVLLTNLLANALKYRKEGQAAEVSVGCGPAESSGRVRLFVADRGPGIPVEMQQRIFELFKRLHRYEQHPGSGIGLALCKRVAENHGTVITVESEAGQGSCFSADLKLQEKKSE